MAEPAPGHGGQVRLARPAHHQRRAALRQRHPQALPVRACFRWVDGWVGGMVSMGGLTYSVTGLEWMDAVVVCLNKYTEMGVQIEAWVGWILDLLTGCLLAFLTHRVIDPSTTHHTIRPVLLHWLVHSPLIHSIRMTGTPSSPTTSSGSCSSASRPSRPH